ncbi:TetR/AcrR family transcriptional regulator [Ectorhizobium quercum]|uniref:TetR/AcrR family transcriptional regulator n=1 Tax=Ectorhizobium quercum TaxID=2965071 RepID=UPI002796386A|nr:TetR/AcrR family transcriptional regulator [Ectorhizobium quercum]
MVAIARRAASYEERTGRTREAILAAAEQEFVANGLSGATMESIAKAAGVNKALVYRHFERKELLFQRVLVMAYRRLRDMEANLEFSDDPVAALEELCSFTLHYYLENPNFLVLVGVENLHKGENLRSVAREELAISKLIRVVTGLLAKGERAGAFRPGLDPVDLWLTLSSLCWFSVAGAYTVDITFGRNIHQPAEAEARLAVIKDVIRRYALRPERLPPI